jgi:hypothetical protein
MSGPPAWGLDEVLTCKHWFPKCAPGIRRGPRPVATESVAIFLKRQFYNLLIFLKLNEYCFIKNDSISFLIGGVFILYDR